METGVVEHGMDLGGLLGFSCADLQVSPIGVRCSSHPGHKGVRLDLHQATPDGFRQPENHAHGGGVCGSGIAGASRGQFALLNNQLGGSICWVLGPAGVETEPS